MIDIRERFNAIIQDLRSAGEPYIANSVELLYADMVAAGVLVPVPVGEPCEYWHKKPGLCMKLGKVYGNSTEISGKYDIVQPVKLLTLAELDATP